ncbi:hypothetical protein VNI00_001858 [Paramarasmius palmivorus]|uniref:Transport protein USO1 n=1 Tax=Paramarasmius palmivorus TaxID=297713 RepID=A0AAW0E4K4_9AGAR
MPPMQTPMQPFFAPQPPPAPGRPHHSHQATISHLAAAGIHPPAGFPITPLAGHFPRPSMALGNPPIKGPPPSGHPFPNRNRRQLSIGGPPKAVLGGPARKTSPLPPAASPSNAPPPTKTKKVVVNLPKETIPGEGGQPSTRPEWARDLLSAPVPPKSFDIPPVEISTAELYPPDGWRLSLPSTVDVFLPGKSAWEAIKQQHIEEKLERLGVERGASAIPHIHAPHARAASISSPADPALLLFKLNKLQQSQRNSANNSLTTSPQPPFGLSPSPTYSAPRFITNRHGHSLSLAQPPTHQMLGVTSNPFGPNATLGSDQNTMQSSPRFSPVPDAQPSETIHAPQGRVPVSLSSLAPPTSAVGRPESKPDFARGFGLDIPEEEEEEEEEEEDIQRQDDGEMEDEDEDEGSGTAEGVVEVHEVEDNENGLSDKENDENGLLTASQSRHHSRHVSRLSAALSMRSFGGLVAEGLNERIQGLQDEETTGPSGDVELESGVEEWTGSEDAFMGGNISDDDESIGEWSNPSDEERARQDRAERRRRNHIDSEQPRRLPNFPKPPENAIVIPMSSHGAEDDIISNPSDEGDYLGIGHYHHPSSNANRSPRPLPPLPHSRGASGQHSVHDPALAHSRDPSSNMIEGSSRPNLNPFAKPFVFGAPAEASNGWHPEAFKTMPEPPNAPMMSHSRLPSVNKPLNAAAQEFKPGGFTFRFPAPVPSFPVPEPGFPVPESRPLPIPPIDESSPFKVQGREKRQRTNSNASVEEGDSMASFRFPPNVDSPASIRRIVSPPPGRPLNPTAEPFTFEGFKPVLPHIQNPGSPEEATLQGESSGKGEKGDSGPEEFTFPSATKAKRAPIPLDFKHPVSSNTVPAGLFKALVNNGDERTRRTVRSRLSSREIFEQVRRPSLDDLDMPPISHKVSRTRLVTDPGHGVISPTDDVFAASSRSHARRRSSLPENMTFSPSEGSSMSEVSSIPAKDLTSRLEMRRYEDRLEQLLDEKIGLIRRDLAKKAGAQGLTPKAEEMISEVVSLFRSQLQESAARSLDDSQMDARGELDFELIKDVVEQGHERILDLLRKELHDVTTTVANRSLDVSATGLPAPDVSGVLERNSQRTISAVVEAISEMSNRLETITSNAPSHHHDALVNAIVSQLGPVLNSLQPEAVDYDYLTAKLSQAVKPHISQIIDLASDKRETAGLIVDRLLPLMPNILKQHAPAVDTDAIAVQLTTEVRRAIAPIDAFEIKEQVADLVVERLDSRLAVRDKSFNVDTVTGKVTENVSRLLEPLGNVSITLSNLMEGQRSLASQQSDLSSANQHVVEIVSDIPNRLTSVVEALKATESNAQNKSIPDQALTELREAMKDVSNAQQSLTENSVQVLQTSQNLMSKITALPDAISSVTSTLQSAHADFMVSRDVAKREMDELRKANADYQVQVAKARGAHGQVRVEKDMLSEKLGIVEADRDRLKAQVKELQALNASKAADAASVESKISDLEDALAKALARLQASDVATQANQDRISELERANQELLTERQSLKSKASLFIPLADSLELKVTFANRDREAAERATVSLQKQYDNLVSQQSNWDALRQTSEQIQNLATLISQADNEELKELRRICDKAKFLEGEHAALKSRFKELENKAASGEKAAATAKQSLAQAQQRSSEWERQSKEYAAKLEITQTQFEQTEQTLSQLETDHLTVKMQLEGRDADERLSKERENSLRIQVAELEAKLSRVQAELDQTQTKLAKASVAAPTKPHKTTNGSAHPLRPESRASTAYVSVSRSATPNGRVPSDRSATPPGPSVWDSMHAPRAGSHYKAPKPVYASRYPSNLGQGAPRGSRRPPVSPPSPTPSAVSTAVTVDEDGWYS